MPTYAPTRTYVHTSFDVTDFMSFFSHATHTYTHTHASPLSPAPLPHTDPELFGFLAIVGVFMLYLFWPLIKFLFDRAIRVGFKMAMAMLAFSFVAALFSEA